MIECVFCKIVEKKVHANIIYEDDDCLAFEDANPQAPIHFLVIPKRHIETILDSDEETLGKLTRTASMLAKEKGIADNGFRTVINCNRQGGQTVYHIHVHVLGGRQLNWPPG